MRRAQSAHPVAWDAWEHRCAARTMDRKTASGSDVDRDLGDIHSVQLDSDNLFLNSRKLSLADYLIKPIQRICRYPLLLDQLRRASDTISLDNHSSSTDVLLERAMASMRRAAQAVDEARRRRDSLARSRIAAARLQAHPRCPFSTPFLDELGACTLVGGLDVVYIDGAEALRQTALHNTARKDSKDNDGAHLDLMSDMHTQSIQYSRTRKSVRAKYLGAFLYNGGYLILAKPIKAGVYEAKHWFQLAGFDSIDVDDMDGTF